MTVMAAYAWPSNADLVSSVLDMLDVPLDATILDPTYGKGNWWHDDTQREVVHHDIAIDGVDFRNLPYANDTFDVTTFDPPYVAVGGRDTSTIKEMHKAYGLTDAPRTHPELLKLICEGLRECVRVTKPKGFVLVKCQAYVTSGKLQDTPGQVKLYASEFTRAELFDELIHLRRPGPQPPHARQVHARRNLSNLLVFRVGA